MENEGSGTEDEDPDYPDRVEINGVPVYGRTYDPAELPIEEWPQYGEDRTLPPYCQYPNAAAVDEEIPDLRMNTVTLIDVENDEGHHPLRTARTMMRLLHCYRESDDERYLEKTESISGAFVDIAAEQDDALYFPYTFDWTSPGGEQRLQAPWYSGMSQGAALTAYAHAYEVSGDDHYRDLADRVFRSFTNVRRTTGDVWTTVVTGTPTEFTDPEDDGPGHLWIEEYPTRRTTCSTGSASGCSGSTTTGFTSTAKPGTPALCGAHYRRGPHRGVPRARRDQLVRPGSRLSRQRPLSQHPHQPVRAAREPLRRGAFRRGRRDVQG